MHISTRTYLAGGRGGLDAIRVIVGLDSRDNGRHGGVAMSQKEKVLLRFSSAKIFYQEVTAAEPLRLKRQSIIFDKLKKRINFHVLKALNALQLAARVATH